MNNRKRIYGINIRVTQAEKERIERNAKRCKLTVSEYLRQLANGYEPRELPNDNLYNLCRDIEFMKEEYGMSNPEFAQYLAESLYDIRKLCNDYTAPERNVR
ncbi:MAG TPA: hypothetical protein PLT66_08775 [Bacillota bacterium]|nr:hypothetical protein [Bacillota bacterium]